MKTRIQSSAGFSLVELMISVVIGMLALLFATRLLTGSEQNRQSAMGGSDSMQNGMLALFSISGDAGQAGYGINDPIITGCDTVFKDVGGGFVLASASRDGVAIQPIAPVVIEPQAAGPDRITFYSGTSASGAATLRVLTDYANGTRVYVDRIPYGFSQGDVILVAPEKGGGKCALAQLSESPENLPPPPGQQYVVIGQGNSWRFNNGGLGTTFTGGASRLVNLGPGRSLSFHTWSVADGYLRLSATDIGSKADAAPVADNIVSLKAQYGFDARGGAWDPAAGMQVTKWSSAMEDADGNGVAGSPGDWERIAAVRLAVVARSKNPERPAKGAACSATVDKPVAFATEAPANVAAAPVTIDVAVAGDPIDWHCYRYRVFETVVPFRNASWRP
jgi:type IV pilus assembly protein PilW